MYVKQTNFYFKLLITAVLLVSVSLLHAQESDTLRLNQLEDRMKNLEKSPIKFSGYFQSQWQYGQEDASLKVGAPNTDTADFNRFGIRRGRVKLSYEKDFLSGVFQIDLTEKGVGIKDAYIQLKAKQVGESCFRAGLFNRPFGQEIEHSSSSRESPERSTIFQTLFPEERDLGMMITLRANNSSAWHFLKLNVGLFAGNGIKSNIKNKKDFIGHLSANHHIHPNILLTGGVSYYLGGVFQGTEKVFKMEDKGFVLNEDPNNKGNLAKREYFGLDVKLRTELPFGKMTLTGEYLFGTQPGAETGSKSPNSATIISSDTYIREFQGGYVTLTQNIGDSPFATVLKYDWYNPNTAVSGNEIGLNHTGKGDLTSQNYGAGLLWEIQNNVRLSAYFDFIKNEKTDHLIGYEKDKKDNVFTMRLQYKF